MLVKFARSEGFHQELKRRVENYFVQTGKPQDSGYRAYRDSAIILGWFLTSYILLVFFSATWWTSLGLAISLGMSMAAIGFNLMHGGSHGALTKSPLFNRLMAKTLDILGGSSYIWHWKHNVFHHSYPNIVGADDDIDAGPVARMAPNQPRYWPHRFQHLYMWFLYGILPMKWHFIDDYKDLSRGTIAQNKFPRPSPVQLLYLLYTKLFFYAWALAIPMFFHPVWTVLLFYAVASFTLGVTLSTVFQLAHCVEEAAFPEVLEDTSRTEHDWAVHQIQTTVDFARRNPVLGWYLGGLNFQVEHHLFPKISHSHYPAISKLVESTCTDFGLQYHAHRTFYGALRSHARWLYRMGRPIVATQADRSTMSSPSNAAASA